MKLPDFTQFEPLNRLRESMQAGELRPFDINLNYQTLTSAELEMLSHTGIVIEDLDEITVLPDGTLSYKDYRVLLHIRDVSVYTLRSGIVSDPELPKFHLVDCKTLQTMRNANRGDRYVVAIRDDGYFQINRINSKTSPAEIKSALEQLNVCKRCLDQLKFNGFSLQGMSEKERAEAVQDFRIARFFDQYPKSLHTFTPKYTANDAPINTYNPNFNEESRQYKIDKGWICGRCREYFGQKDRQRLLHVHHRNGQKFDDRKSNWQALCIECHAEQDFHGHMKPLLYKDKKISNRKKKRR